MTVLPGWAQRVVELRAGRGLFTGYRIGADLVLTACHGRVKPGAAVDMRTALGTEWIEGAGTVEWTGYSRAPLLDVAVVRLSRAALLLAPAPARSARWARIEGERPVAGHAYGFPEVAAVDGHRDLQVLPRLSVTGDGASRWNVLKVDVADAAAAVPVAWQGLSGAPVLDGEGRILGVIAGVPDGAVPGHLRATGLLGMLAAEGLPELLGLTPESIEAVGERCPFLAPAVVRRQWAKMTVSERLKARHAEVPFVEAGRERELAELTEWCGGGDPAAARLVIGAAGVGKSRLVVELCERLSREGWDAGFLDGDAAAVTAGAWTPRRDTLVVVDYAEARAQREPFRQVFRRVRDLDGADDGGLGVRVRLLLVSRHDPGSGGWVRELDEGGALVEALARTGNETIALSSVDFEADVRAAHLEKAYAHFHARENGGAAPERPAPEAAGRYDRPLLVHIAALLDVLGEPIPDPATEGARSRLLDQLLARERERWWTGAFAVAHPDHADQAVAIAALTAPSVAECRELLRAAPVWADRPTAERDAAARRLRELYDGGTRAGGDPRSADDHLIAPLEPDLVAEHLIATTGEIDAILAALIEHGALTPAHHRRLLHIMDLAADEYPRLRERYRDLRGWSVRALLDAVDVSDERLPELLAERLPDLVASAVASATELNDFAPGRRLAAAVTYYENEPAVIAAAIEADDRVPGTRDHRIAELALAVSQLATRAYADRAVADRRALPLYAASLSDLGVRYGNAGRVNEALSWAESAVEASRIVASEWPGFRPELAAALVNLGNRYGELGLRNEALAVTEEAVAVLRVEADRAPRLQPDLLRALICLGACHDDLGQAAEALSTAEEAVALLRARTGERALPSELAAALGNLGVQYSAAGRMHEAVAAAEEAAGLQRARVAADPAGRPDLALALSQLGSWYEAVGRSADALAVAEEAVGLYRALAAESPVHLPELAKALVNLGNHHDSHGRFEDALAGSREAVELLRACAAENPAYEAYLGIALINLGIRCTHVERPGEALAAAEESVALLRTHAEAYEALVPELALALVSLGNRHAATGRLYDALDAAQEGVALYQRLAAEVPGHLPRLADALLILAKIQAQLPEYRAVAAMVAEDAERVYRELLPQAPDRFAPKLATARELLTALRAR